MSESDLITASQKGDIEAFSHLVELYQRNVRACLAVRLENRFEVDDLAQETFLVAFRKIGDFDADKAFGPWVRSIAFYLLKNYWRKHKAEAIGGAAELQLLIDEEIGLKYSNENESDSLAALKICTGRLNEEMQKIVHLHYHQGLSVQDITEKLAIKHSTMTMRLHRMRDQLRKCINDNIGSCEL